MPKTFRVVEHAGNMMVPFSSLIITTKFLGEKVTGELAVTG